MRHILDIFILENCLFFHHIYVPIWYACDVNFTFYESQIIKLDSNMSIYTYIATIINETFYSGYRIYHIVLHNSVERLIDLETLIDL